MLTGIGLQVTVTINGKINDVYQDGSLGRPFQFSSPSAAASALATAIANNSGTMSQARIFTTPA